MTEAQARRIVRQAYQPGHALAHNPMHRGGGRSDLTLPLPRSMLSPPSGGGLLWGTTVSDSFPRHELTGRRSASRIRGVVRPSAVCQALKSSASGSGGWVKNSASGSSPPAGLPARLVSQNGEAGVISKRTYFGMYTPAPRLARLLWATTVLWYTSLASGFLSFYVCGEGT